MVDVELEGRVRALLAAQESGKSGALEIRAPEGVTIVYFHAGRAVFAEEGTLGETLGRLLVQQGRLTQEQYAHVIDHMTERIVHNETMRFGEAAIELGLLTADQVHDALADQVKRKIGRALRWEHAAATFRESSDAIEGLARFPCAVEPVVLSVCREHFDRNRLQEIVAVALGKRWVAPPATAVAERFGATPADLRVARTLDGSQTLAECLDAHGDDAALPIVAALVLTGALELPPARSSHEPAPPVARARVATPVFAAATPLAAPTAAAPTATHATGPSAPEAAPRIAAHATTPEAAPPAIPVAAAGTTRAATAAATLGETTTAAPVATPTAARAATPAATPTAARAATPAESPAAARAATPAESPAAARAATPAATPTAARAATPAESPAAARAATSAATPAAAAARPQPRPRRDTPTTRIAHDVPMPPPLRDEEREAEARRRATAAAASLWLGRRATAAADPQRARLVAEQSFQRGRRFVRDGNFERAAPELRRAVELFPEADEYRLYVAFVELRRASDDAARAKLLPGLAKRVREVLKRDSSLAFAHYVDAHLALAEGDIARAERCFRTTLRLDPTEIDAERQLRLLASRNPKPKR